MKSLSKLSDLRGYDPTKYQTDVNSSFKNTSTPTCCNNCPSCRHETKFIRTENVGNDAFSLPRYSKNSNTGDCQSWQVGLTINLEERPHIARFWERLVRKRLLTLLGNPSAAARTFKCGAVRVDGKDELSKVGRDSSFKEYAAEAAQ